MRKYIFFIFSLGMVLSLNLYFRTFPLNLPQLKTQSQNVIADNIQRLAIQEIDKKFPQFDKLARQRLKAVFISDYKKQNKNKIKKDIQEEYLRLKDKYQDEQGLTYLMELDGWHWARYVDNVLRLGRPGDKVINGQQWDNLMLAPLGTPLLWNQFFFYLCSFLYKIVSGIRSLPLFSFLFFLPLFFTTLFIIVLYLFCFFYGGNLMAVVTTLFVGLSPIFLSRTSVGWFDLDILTLLFPVLVVWSYLLAYAAGNLRQRFFWICLSCFWMGLFCFTWTSWWFIFLVILISQVYSLLNLIFVYWQYKERNLKLFNSHLFSLILYISFTFLGITIFGGFQPLVFLYRHLKESFILNNPLTNFVWPNVYATVGELRRPSQLEIAHSLGGSFLFISSLICMLAIFLWIMHHKKYATAQYQLIILLIFWFLSMFFASFKGARFTMFMLIPLGICLGWFIEEAYRYSTDKKKKSLRFLILVITTLFIAIFITNANYTARGIFPMMTDTWYRALIKIKEITAPNAVINSWWDFGDWFKTVSQRRVIFDGQSQNVPQAYWMARILLSQDEKEAMGILRMLNNGGNRAFEIINEHLKDPYKSVILLSRLFVREPQEAKKRLSEFLPLAKTEEIIELVFGKPDKAYFVVDYSMLIKASPISYLGNWNFAKVYLVKNIHKQHKQQLIDYLLALGTDAQEVKRLMTEAALISQEDLTEHWITQRLKFYGGLVKGHKNNDLVFFDNSLVYHLNTESIYLYSLQEGKYKIPRILFILENDKLKEITYPNYDLDFSVLVFNTQDPEDYRAIIFDRGLENSLLVRLYFFGGRGLKYFKPVIAENDGDDYIRVFEIVWDSLN